MKKILAIFLTLLLLFSLTAGCEKTSAPTPSGGDTPAPAGTSDRVLHLRKPAPVASLDWEKTTDLLDMGIVWIQMTEGLYGMNEAEGGYFNLLAKDIQVSDDQKTYTVSLVDATFQNGDPMKAGDVVFSYERAMANPKFNYVTSMIEKIEASDDKTVVFTLKYPYSPIAHTFFTVKIQSEKEVTAAGEQFGTVPHKAGTGPYYATKYDVGGDLELEAYENYWRGSPNIKKVQYKVISEDSAAVIAFENGEIDYLNDAPVAEWEAIEKKAAGNSLLVKGNNIRSLYINWQSPQVGDILKKQEVREAICYAVNRDNLVQGATNGLGVAAYEYVPSDYVSTAPNYKDGKFELYDHNLEKSKELLLKAGYTEEEIKAGIDLGTLVTYGGVNSDKGKAAQVLQASLAEAGFKVQVDVKPDYNGAAPVLHTFKYDLAIFGDGGNYDFNNIRQQVHSESEGMDLILYKAPDSPFDGEKIEKWLDDAVNTSDVAKRKAIYTDLWAYIQETATILPLYHNPVGVAWSSDLDPESISPTYYHIFNFKWK